MTPHTNIVEGLKHLAVPVAELSPDPKNARKHDRRNLDAIKASLEKFGFRQPIIVQKQGMIVRAGNGRLAVSKELGWSHIPALVVDEAEADAVAFAIADNRTAELAEWDVGVLGEVLADLRGDEDGAFDLGAVGFTNEELNVLLVDDLWAGEDDEALAEENEARFSEPRSAATGGTKIIFQGEHDTALTASYTEHKVGSESIADFVVRHLPGADNALG